MHCDYTKSVHCCHQLSQPFCFYLPFPPPLSFDRLFLWFYPSHHLSICVRFWCMVYMQICTRAHVYMSYIYMHYIYTCTTCISCACKHTRILAYIHTHICYTYNYLCIVLRTYSCICICTFAYLHIQLYMYKAR